MRPLAKTDNSIILSSVLLCRAPLVSDVGGWTFAKPIGSKVIARRTCIMGRSPLVMSQGTNILFLSTFMGMQSQVNYTVQYIRGKPSQLVWLSFDTDKGISYLLYRTLSLNESDKTLLREGHQLSVKGTFHSLKPNMVKHLSSFILLNKRSCPPFEAVPYTISVNKMNNYIFHIILFF